MIGMDCVNQQARERDCKLTKRSQAERLAIADSLIASVWEEYLNGSIDRDNLQVAAYIQANANRIVWKLNALNNPNTPNTLEALDCISRQDAIDLIEDIETKRLKGEIGLIYAPVIKGLNALPSVQSKNEERMEKSAQYVPNDDLISRKAAIDALMEDFKRIPTNAIRAKTVIEQLPSAQPDIIRCEDCKWYGRADKRRFYRGMDCLQKRIDTIVPDKDFCSKAERRTDEQT